MNLFLLRLTALGLGGRRRLSPRRAASSGFTLVEVLAAVAILAFALLAVISMRNESVRELAAVNRYSDAWVIGARRMGEIETQEVLDEGSGGGGICDENPNYEWRATVTKVEVDIAGQYFPGQERAANPHKPKELLRIDLVVGLVQPEPDQPPEIFHLVAYAKKRRPGMPP